MEKIVGIDVSKDRLDVPQAEAFSVGNDHAGIDELIVRLNVIGADAIALEATGVSRRSRWRESPRRD